MDTQSTKKNSISEIIKVYDNKIVKLYCWARFMILRKRFLDEIGQYLPREGHVLDIGCGFGLFSLYFAQNLGKLAITGIDINTDRIDAARMAAQKLNVINVQYEIGDAISYSLESKYDSIYMLDIVHHIPREAVRPLLARLHSVLTDKGKLIIKDVQTKPKYKLLFTWLLDKLMNWRATPHYWEKHELSKTLQNLGFEVYTHNMNDILPYPHIIYICLKN